MAFIISKTSTRWDKRRSLYYLVKNYRDGKKIRRKTILCLGESNSLDEAIKQNRKIMNSVKSKIAEIENTIVAIREGKPYMAILGVPHYRQLQRYIEALERRKEELKALQDKEKLLFNTKNEIQRSAKNP